ncbi:MAG: sigma-54-dependent Fis family transcriptional regulator, partial [Deltaproteobacteria bacterium]|nr:sigma-54-dependent Fis family transcriptional regulator [Deltaproteobacteria bacterium]
MKQKHKILIIEDDPSLREVIAFGLQDENLEILSAGSGEYGLELFESSRGIDLVLTDVKMPGIDGIEVLKRVKALNPLAEVVMMTAYGNVELAVEAMKQGASDYLTKPVGMKELKVRIAKALEKAELTREKDRLLDEVAFERSRRRFVTVSPRMKSVIEKVKKIAPTNASVLISGESGTGKELIARMIHDLSLRKNGQFVTINCSAIPKDLLESELFGHEKGAFTGAIRKRIGSFEAADGGTIFLDEIGDMSYELQAKILRALQEKMIDIIGGKASVPVDVRIISASNKNLKELAAKNLFRDDLYYRLNVIEINLPPIRERREDIPALARHFLKEYAGGLDIRFADNLMERMKTLPWKGNVRELKNCVERLV